jgi:flagellin
VTATDYLNRLNAAAQPFFAVGHTPFTGSAGGLTFTGATPGVGSTAQQGATLTPRYAGQSGASSAIPLIDAAIDSLSSLRASLGAIENRFEHAIGGLQVTMENHMSSVSRIADADMAAEMAAFTRDQVLSQAGTAMLSQATRHPGESILALLR